MGRHRLFFDIVLRDKSERPRASVILVAPPSGGVVPVWSRGTFVICTIIIINIFHV